MKKLTEDETGSFQSYLSEGCSLCQQGAKLVLFITGLCSRNCFYCPLSEERKGKDLIFANEKAVEADSDLLEEAKLMDALGTGITGGEPLLKVERVLYYIRLLKATFGKEHHIHLYTSLAPDRKTLLALDKAGLDELRFHPPQKYWGNLEKSSYAFSIQEALDLGIRTGIEIPALPGAENVALFAAKAKIFLNLNELEFSETNAKGLNAKGFSLESDLSNAAAGSRKIGELACKAGKKVHFCSSNYKDAVQLRKRLLRIAENTAREFDEVTEDGTLIYGLIKGGIRELKFACELLKAQAVPAKLFEAKETGIEIAWWILEELQTPLKNSGTSLSIIERYPFKDGLIVEVFPL
ncbi:MAG: radical SAM protein [Methanosarcinaceae archaeon]|nr:radical SAM protein [Methanosarcinaceae archaeon]MDD4750070.1 radical SAM protein [Methanosarcinaceae archaeon]